MSIEAEALFGCIEYRRMVERHLRQTRQRVPRGLGRIVTTDDVRQVFAEPGDPDDADRPAPWVSPRVSPRSELFKSSGELQPRLLRQLPPSGVFQPLALIDETSGKRPPASERLSASADQQHALRALSARDHRDVHRESRSLECRIHDSSLRLRSDTRPHLEVEVTSSHERLHRLIPAGAFDCTSGMTPGYYFRCKRVVTLCPCDRTFCRIGNYCEVITRSTRWVCRSFGWGREHTVDG